MLSRLAQLSEVRASRASRLGGWQSCQSLVDIKEVQDGAEVNGWMRENCHQTRSSSAASIDPDSHGDFETSIEQRHDRAAPLPSSKDEVELDREGYRMG